MNERPETQKEEPRPPASVITCLTSGFELITHAPQLLMLPVVLDLFLWLGPRLSADILFQTLAARVGTATSAEMQAVTTTLGKLLTQLAHEYNLFAFLNPGPLLGTPSLMSSKLFLETPLGGRHAIPVPTFSASLGWIVILMIVGLGISALYLQQIGRAVIAYTEAPLPGPISSLRLWGQLLQLALLLAFFLGGGVLFTALTVGPLFLLSQGFAGVVMLLFMSFGFFVLMHFIFTIPGMVQLRHSPFRAMQESILLVRVDFSGTMQLLLLSLVFIQGLNVVWNLPKPNTWATLVSIAGHAIVSTALTVALFIFYQERLTYLRLLQNAFATKPAQATTP